MEGKTRVRFVVVVARISPKSRTGFRRPSFLKVVGRFSSASARIYVTSIFNSHSSKNVSQQMYYRALACFCLFSAGAVIFSSSTPRHKQRTLFLFYFFFSSTNRNRSFPSNLSRSECLSKPLRSVRFEPYFPSSVSPRRLESRP